MKVHLDRVDGMHVIEGWEQYRFSSREDAQTGLELALEFAQQFAALQMQREWRYRKAAQRGMEVAV